MKSLSLLILTISLAASASAADLKVGVVDMERAIKEFYKTKERNAVIQKNAADANEKWQDRVNAFNKLREEAAGLKKEASDPVLSEGARGKKAAEFQRKVAELESLDKEAREFRSSSNEKLQYEDMKNRKELFAEIAEIVRKKSAEDGYDLVFDKGGSGISFIPLLLHSKEGITTDFTSELIVLLNKDAPAGAASGAPPAAPEKKDDEKKATEKKTTEKKGSGKGK